VTWFSAVEFCNKLSENEGLSPYYMIDGIRRRNNHSMEYADVTVLGGNGFRLPTEAEWEYACRAGSITPWCFGDLVLEVGQYAWYYDNTQLETQPVGVKKPNAWGLYDMHGNVSEWCLDYLGSDYPNESVTNPIGLYGIQALRGGAYNSMDFDCRSASRFGNDASFKGTSIGFRLVLVRTNYGPLSTADDTITSLEQFLNIEGLTRYPVNKRIADFP
jgi:formylglycine-generating enzyme required for sulfatase activity